MTLSDMKRAFFDHEDEYLEFEDVKEKLSTRKDLHAFILLDRLVPGSDDMVVAAEHDEIWLGVALKLLARAATMEQIVDLIRCGVRLGDDEDSLCMFA